MLVAGCLGSSIVQGDGQGKERKFSLILRQMLKEERGERIKKVYVSENETTRQNLPNERNKSQSCCVKKSPERKGSVMWKLVPHIDQQVACHQLGTACLEFGTRWMENGR